MLDNAEDCIRSASRRVSPPRRAVAALRIQSVELSRVGRAFAYGDSIPRGTLGRWVGGGKKVLWSPRRDNGRRWTVPAAFGGTSSAWVQPRDPAQRAGNPR